MGWGSSSTHKSKIQAGVYSQTRGHYPEAQLARAMRTPPLPKDGRVELRSRCLAAVDDNDKTNNYSLRCARADAAVTIQDVGARGRAGGDARHLRVQSRQLWLAEPPPSCSQRKCRKLQLLLHAAIDEDTGYPRVLQEASSLQERRQSFILVLISGVDVISSAVMMGVAFKFAYRAIGASLYCLGLQAISHMLSSIILIVRLVGELGVPQDAEESLLREKRRRFLYREQGLNVVMGLAMLVAAAALVFKAARKIKFWDKWYLDHRDMDTEAQWATEFLAWYGFAFYLLQAIARFFLGRKLRRGIVWSALVNSVISLVFLLVMGLAASYEKEGMWKAEPICAIVLAIVSVVEGIRIVISNMDDMATVFDTRTKCAAIKQVLFEVKLSGPDQLIQNWEAACQRYESFLQQRGQKLDKQALQVPHPVFIPSRGRPEKAHLNWEAPHVFGPQEKEPGLAPVVCIVVEPEEEEAYRGTWPLALMLVLPEGNRGPGYARWVVQTVCTRATVTGGCAGPCQTATMLRRLGRIWIVDDTLTTFYRLAWMHNFRQCGRLARPKRMKHRVASSELMFVEALLAVQRHPFAGRAAVAGFLRDDGTAVCKRAEWKLDELALYKVVLLDLNELRRLQVEYVPGLQMYEDICLNHDVLSRGGRTLKCQCYGFRAVHAKMGGCLQQRAGHRAAGKSTGITKLEDLVQPAAFASMDHDRQKAIGELLRWVQDKETLYRKRSSQEPDQPSSNARKRKESSENSDRTDGRTGSSDVKVELPEAIIVSDDSDFEELKMTSANTDIAPLAWGLPSQRVMRKT
ncbi:hypothetical protein AK812_SmicGene5552 [Symbiodinium microadriaticum]|uniref:TET-Associated Glycosyltransferase domain-containing protein n=1 Tax=Symbiodinium microadriaticum TaxID=2951 RepID=A0A1Q9ETG9_SYMMI|nr:hypothetical protein AK812_SmicGene5552 [Symbiodinium microadriaticum]